MCCAFVFDCFMSPLFYAVGTSGRECTLAAGVLIICRLTNVQYHSHCVIAAILVFQMDKTALLIKRNRCIMNRHISINCDKWCVLGFSKLAYLPYNK